MKRYNCQPTRACWRWCCLEWFDLPGNPHTVVARLRCCTCCWGTLGNRSVRRGWRGTHLGRPRIDQQDIQGNRLVLGSVGIPLQYRSCIPMFRFRSKKFLPGMESRWRWTFLRGSSSRVPCMVYTRYVYFVEARWNTDPLRTWYKTFGHEKFDTVQAYKCRNWFLRMQQLFRQIFQLRKNSWCLRNTKYLVHIRFGFDRCTGTLLRTWRSCQLFRWRIPKRRNWGHNCLCWRGLRQEDLIWICLFHIVCKTVDRFGRCLKMKEENCRREGKRGRKFIC